MLNSLLIENFRSLERLEVPTLGKVNLIIGKNNSGKSSVLDALKLYASFVDESVLVNIVDEHDEFFILEEDTAISPYESLFYGRRFKDNHKIIIGELNNSDNQIIIEASKALEVHLPLDKEANPLRAYQVSFQDINEIEQLELNQEDSNIVNTLKINQEKKHKRIILDNLAERIRQRNRKIKNTVKSYSDITTSFISNDELADSWDKVGLRDYAEEVLKSLQIIEPKIRAINFVNSKDWSSGSFYAREKERRIPLVRIEGLDFPVPLKSMGDGIIRLFQLALRLYEAKDGFLFIDEFENGLHFGVQRQAWETIFSLSQKLNIQVFASTHSWDCIESFTQVALERTDIAGCLFRLGKPTRGPNKDKTTATVFTEDDLKILSQSHVEVR
ncbi:AAA family ATPase [Acinetobacter baumannii]|uniref:AAA family ATPase n=1 Tax=Acinetobacter baumannii TaxID=470 RepID=UPI00233FC71F|nr:AAA family ATPase [Acinetobacter baumannii]MDC5278613.1 AAA family ATPase [Acinetobacter baumannii]MDV4216789.1 AAA family ATPase [Acinetobacter baumannii]MDV7659800.1 AAA family ATPase [Acinetobacter baumannii]HEO1776273.1 AAA family ATPase [Acinetobacter baumannii]